jgi:hypothetical protein
MKATEREQLIAFIKGFDSFYDCYNFDLYTDEDLAELKGYVDEVMRSSYRFR